MHAALLGASICHCAVGKPPFKEPQAPLTVADAPCPKCPPEERANTVITIRPQTSQDLTYYS